MPRKNREHVKPQLGPDEQTARLNSGAARSARRQQTG